MLHVVHVEVERWEISKERLYSRLNIVVVVTEEKKNNGKERKGKEKKEHSTMEFEKQRNEGSFLLRLSVLRTLQSGERCTVVLHHRSLANTSQL